MLFRSYIGNIYTTRTGKQTTPAWLRSEAYAYEVSCVNDDAYFQAETTRYRAAGLCPSLHYHLPRDESEKLEQFDIREVKDTEGKVIYHTLQIGEYPKTKVDEDLSRILESLYHGGKIQEGIVCTGRWYSSK